MAFLPFRRASFRAPPVAACAFLLSMSIRAQPARTLTPGDIDEAIEWGTHGNPAPYQLHHKGRAGIAREQRNPVIVGIVYAPFVRVALMAKAAHDAFRELTRDDIPADVLQPVMYVAYRWYCCVDAEHGNRFDWHPLTPPSNYQIVVPDTYTARRVKADVASPLWISRDVSMLAKLGGESPYSDVVLVAAYPITALSAGREFIMYTEWPSSRVAGATDIDFLRGQVTAEDVT